MVWGARHARPSPPQHQSGVMLEFDKTGNRGHLRAESCFRATTGPAAALVRDRSRALRASGEMGVSEPLSPRSVKRSGGA